MILIYLGAFYFDFHCFLESLESSDNKSIIEETSLDINQLYQTA